MRTWCRRTRSRSRSSARPATRSSCSTCSRPRRGLGRAARQHRGGGERADRRARPRRPRADPPRGRAGLTFRAARLRARARAGRARRRTSETWAAAVDDPRSSTPTATCASAARSSARSPTPGCRSGCGARCTLAVGEALERDLGSDVDADPAVLSLHFSRAGDHARAWRYALLGAERASARFAAADAARLYRTRDRRASRRGDARRELARGLGVARRGADAGRRDAAAERRTRLGARLIADDPVAQARICFRRGQIAERSELPRAVRWMTRGLRTLEQRPAAARRSAGARG